MSEWQNATSQKVRESVVLCWRVDNRRLRSDQVIADKYGVDDDYDFDDEPQYSRTQFNEADR